MQARIKKNGFVVLIVAVVLALISWLAVQLAG